MPEFEPRAADLGTHTGTEESGDECTLCPICQRKYLPTHLDDSLALLWWDWEVGEADGPDVDTMQIDGK